MSRIDKHEAMMQVAEIISQRATCIRRSVGAVITNKDGIVLATGFNGVPQGLDHCNEKSPCTDSKADSGTRVDECLAIDAEQNALIQLSNFEQADNIYVTTSPCIHCTKMLLNTKIQTIYYKEEYIAGLSLWRKAGRKAVKI